MPSARRIIPAPGRSHLRCWHRMTTKVQSVVKPMVSAPGQEALDTRCLLVECRSTSSIKRVVLLPLRLFPRI
jgi:hypothetical protein